MPDFSKITKSIVDIMKGNTNFKWTKEGKASFEQIKSAIANAPTLSYPDFSKDFHLYCYASKKNYLLYLHNLTRTMSKPQ